MHRTDLREHKKSQKRLAAFPNFLPLSKKNNSLPKPLDGLGRRKDAHATKVIALSETHCAVFLYRDGEILTDRVFFGYLFCRLSNGALSTLFEFHWHPSHKGLHCKLPCRTTLDYTGRLLVHAPEFNLNMERPYDPALEDDRRALVRLFCGACGVTIEYEDNEPPPSPLPDPQEDFFK